MGGTTFPCSSIKLMSAIKVPQTSDASFVIASKIFSDCESNTSKSFRRLRRCTLFSGLAAGNVISAWPFLSIN